MRAAFLVFAGLAFVGLPTSALGDDNDDPLAPLVKGLESKKATERAKAADDLAKLGKKGLPAARRLCELIAADKSPSVRRHALEALEKIHPDRMALPATRLSKPWLGKRLRPSLLF